MTVKQYQALLTYLGYDPGGVDGANGPNTTAAIKEFQAAEGLTVDGTVGNATEAALLDAVAEGRFKTEETASITESNSSLTGTFWDNIKYFSRSEFKCQCGGKYCNGYPAEPSEALVRIAESLREEIGKPIIITSGLRCATHNAEVGGVSNSRHISGKAMDFYVSGWTASQLLAKTQARSDLRYSYAINDNCVHMDVV